jgi:hypothetical protein
VAWVRAPNILPGFWVAVFPERLGPAPGRLGPCWRIKTFSGKEEFWVTTPRGAARPSDSLAPRFGRIATGTKWGSTRSSLVGSLAPGAQGVNFLSYSYGEAQARAPG